MKELVQSLPMQLTEALMIGRSYQFKARSEDTPITNVILTGLGGSGIGGSIVQNYVFGKLKVPFLVNKDYFLPAFTGKGSLVIVSSYSGNTEETIAAMKQAMKAGAQVVCITSGGKIAEMAKKKDIDCILLPAGNPPRASLAYSLVQVLFALKGAGLLRAGFEKEIEAAISLLNEEAKDIRKKAKSLAGKLSGKLPIFYASAEYEGLAIRVRQQINENSKMLAWHGVIPEMNHNELVGWRDKAPDKAVVIFRTEDDYERNQTRMEINKKIIRKYTSNIYEVYAKGKSYLEKLFYFIHLTDWVSVDLADMHGVDATEVKVIDYLKGELAGS